MKIIPSLTVCSLFLNSLWQFHQLSLKPMHSNLSHYISCKLSHLATQGRHFNLHKKLQHSDQGKTSNLNCGQWIKDTTCVPSLFVLQASYRSKNHQDKKKSTIQIPYSGRSTFTSMSSWSLYSFLHDGVSWKETDQIPHSGRLHIHIHVFFFFFLTLFLPTWWYFLKKNCPNPAFRKLLIHSHVFFFLLTLFLTTWWCFPEEKVSKSCILEGSTFTNVSFSFSLYSLLHGGASSPLSNLICVCVGAQAANPVESSPVTAEKNRKWIPLLVVTRVLLLRKAVRVSNSCLPLVLWWTGGGGIGGRRRRFGGEIEAALELGKLSHSLRLLPRVAYVERTVQLERFPRQDSDQSPVRRDYGYKLQRWVRSLLHL